MTERLAQFGRYSIVRELGASAFATVYVARDTLLDRDVALKVLHPALLNDRRLAQNLLVRTGTIASLRHQYIIEIYEIGNTDGRLFIAMELVSGISLAETIAKQGRITWDRTLTLLRPICDALDYTHSRGIVHRDLKPNNILLDPHRGPLLSDFGFTKLLAENADSLTMSGAIFGKPGYIAPEVWEQNDDNPPVDIYALGCIVYEMLTGDVLFKGQTLMQAMLAHALEPQFPETWPLDVPGQITAVLSKALARNPAARYPNAMALWNALNELQVTFLRSPSVTLEPGDILQELLVQELPAPTAIPPQQESEDVLQRLLILKQRRLNYLKLQAAPYGNRAEPSILIEIEDLESEILDLRGHATELMGGRSRAVGGQGITWHKPAPVVKNRRVDAAMPREALLNERVDLIIQVRFPNSKPLGEKDADWPLHSKPATMTQTSERMGLKFNPDPWTGTLEPAQLEVVLISQDFTVEGSEHRRIEVPANEYSKRVVFLITPRRIGRARVNIEVYNLQHVYLGTIAIENEITGAFVAKPIVVVGNILLAVEVAPLPSEVDWQDALERSRLNELSKAKQSLSKMPPTHSKIPSFGEYTDYSTPESEKHASHRIAILPPLLIILAVLLIIFLINYFGNR